MPKKKKQDQSLLETFSKISNVHDLKQFIANNSGHPHYERVVEFFKDLLEMLHIQYDGQKKSN